MDRIPTGLVKGLVLSLPCKLHRQVGNLPYYAFPLPNKKPSPTRDGWATADEIEFITVYKLSVAAGSLLFRVMAKNNAWASTSFRTPRTLPSPNKQLTTDGWPEDGPYS